jgi:uncharacterized protein (TIGR02453 family)
MAQEKSPLSSDTFRFLKDLEKNNKKTWMDANRDRYRAALVEPFRGLLERLAPHMLSLSPEFLVTGRSGDNFSRINRDTRFAREKHPYRTHYYLFFRGASGRRKGRPHFYVGASPKTVTVGLRIYHEGRGTELAEVAVPRAMENTDWLRHQKRRLSRIYESYWYSTERGAWAKHEDWPVDPAEWKKVKGWIVRRRFLPSAATRPNFASEIEVAFRHLFPLYIFLSRQNWSPGGPTERADAPGGLNRFF